MNYQEFLLAALLALLLGGVLVNTLLWISKKVMLSYFYYQLTPKVLKKYKAEDKK